MVSDGSTPLVFIYMRKRAKKFIKKFIRLSIFGVVIFGGWQANLKWEAFKPILTELEEKDPEKYAKMVDEAKFFHINEAINLYRQLDKMTFADVIDLRYKKFLEKRKADKKFREKSYDEELQIRIKERAAKLEDNKSRIEDLKILRQKKSIKVRFGEWGKMNPWRQGLILREKCVKYFKKEMEDRQARQDGLKVSRLSTLVSRPGKEPLEAELLCNDLVSSAARPEDVQDSILRLKKSMSFYYFTRLLNETGIPRETIFAFDEKLEGMTNDHNGP